MKKKAYIAGAISGTDLKHTAARFKALENVLTEIGYEVYNPFEINQVDIDNHRKPWVECMKADIKVLLDCDEMHLLHGWNESKGVIIERDLARRLGIKIVYH